MKKINLTLATLLVSSSGVWACATCGQNSSVRWAVEEVGMTLVRMLTVIGAL